MTEKTDMLQMQDPLPESNWLWRRVFCFAVTAGLMFFMWGLTDRLGKVAFSSPQEGIPALLAVSKWTIAFAGLVVTYYLLAPSAEQITKLIKTASLLRAGVQIASRSVERPGRREVATTVGTPPQPVVPPESPQSASDDEADEPERVPPVGMQEDEVTSNGDKT